MAKARTKKTPSKNNGKANGKGPERKPVIAITMGDPTGIGPEVILKSLTDRTIRQKIKPIIFGDKGVLQHVANEVGIKVKIQEITSLDSLKKFDDDRVIYVRSISNLKMNRLRYGRPDRNCGRAMVNYVKEAVKACLDGYCEAMVTAPINKEIINEAGYRYGGHTDMISELTGTRESTMMFVSKHFKVSLVTIHVPLKNVAMRITPQKIYKVGLLTWKTLWEFFGMKNPKIAVAGLNPHAGEGGVFGDEERDLIYPAVVSLKSIGIDAQGPISPDTVFWRAYNGEFDAVIAMYHDQALIPVKLIDFRNAVNVTIGIPIIRTSPSHGTAYDIAGKGIADPSSMKHAILLAAQMAETRRKMREERKKSEEEEKRAIQVEKQLETSKPEISDEDIVQM